MRRLIVALLFSGALSGCVGYVYQTQPRGTIPSAPAIEILEQPTVSGGALTLVIRTMCSGTDSKIWASVEFEWGKIESDKYPCSENQVGRLTIHGLPASSGKATVRAFFQGENIYQYTGAVPVSWSEQQKSFSAESYPKKTAEIERRLMPHPAIQESPRQSSARVSRKPQKKEWVRKTEKKPPSPAISDEDQRKLELGYVLGKMPSFPPKKPTAAPTTPPPAPAGKPVQPEPVPSIVPSKGAGPDNFPSNEMCRVAAGSGNYRVYLAKSRRAFRVNPVDGKKIFRVQLKDHACVEMRTTQGTKWVVQIQGTFVRALTDGKIIALDWCGNEIRAVDYLVPVPPKNKVST